MHEQSRDVNLGEGRFGNPGLRPLRYPGTCESDSLEGQQGRSDRGLVAWPQRGGHAGDVLMVCPYCTLQLLHDDMERRSLHQ
jgi:hypothetical protein